MTVPTLRRWLDRFWKALTTGNKRRKRKELQHRVFPRLEALEERWTPAAPVVKSILRSNPTGQFTSAATVDFAVTFDQTVTGVDSADFKTARTGSLLASPSIAVSGSGSSYT